MTRLKENDVLFYCRNVKTGEEFPSKKDPNAILVVGRAKPVSMLEAGPVLSTTQTETKHPIARALAQHYLYHNIIPSVDYEEKFKDGSKWDLRVFSLKEGTPNGEAKINQNKLRKVYSKKVTITPLKRKTAAPAQAEKVVKNRKEKEQEDLNDINTLFANVIHGLRKSQAYRLEAQTKSDMACSLIYAVSKNTTPDYYQNAKTLISAAYGTELNKFTEDQKRRVDLAVGTLNKVSEAIERSKVYATYAAHLLEVTLIDLLENDIAVAKHYLWYASTSYRASLRASDRKNMPIKVNARDIDVDKISDLLKKLDKRDEYDKVVATIQKIEQTRSKQSVKGPSGGYRSELKDVLKRLSEYLETTVKEENTDEHGQ